jgi:hypothetical protein
MLPEDEILLKSFLLGLFYSFLKGFLSRPVRKSPGLLKIKQFQRPGVKNRSFIWAQGFFETSSKRDWLLF